MKMKGAKQVHYDSGPNMTPLVDVVMVILIFFMLAGNFGDKDHYLASTVPIKQKGTPIKTDTVPNDVDLRITVDQAGSERFVARMEGDDTTYINSQMQQLTDALAAKLKGYLDAGKKPDDIQVLISPGSTVKYNNTIQVYAAALSAEVESGGKKLGFTKVSFEQEH